jgi:type IV pilus assembly protein PilM
MLNMRNRRANKLVLDIGSSAVRLCELSPTKAGYQLTKYYEREYGLDPSMDEEQQTELRVSALQEILKEAKVRSRKAIIAVPGQSVFTRTRALPPVPEYKVMQIVRYEIQQQIPFSLDQIALSYQVLNRTEVGGYDVLMAAIKVDVVEKQMDIAQRAKCAPLTVDVAPIAGYNWLRHTGDFGEENDCVAVVDLGASTTDIVIEREGQFRFTRSCSVGGNEVTKAIAEGFGMSWLEAEKLKKERGFAPTGDAERDGKGGEVIGRILQRLVGEINRSFSYFRSQPGGGAVNRMVITGGGAGMRNIVPFLQRHLGVEVRIAQPLTGLAVAPAAQSVNDAPERAVVSLGLALRNHETPTIELDLIPPRIIEAARSREQTVYWAMSLVTLGLIIASIVPVKLNENAEYLEQIRQVESVIRQYDAALLVPPLSATRRSEAEDQLSQAMRRIEDYQGRVHRLDEVNQERQLWLRYLAAVNNARPTGQGVWVSSFETTVIGQRGQQQQMRGGFGGGEGGGPNLGGLSALGGGGLRGMDGDGAQSVPSSGFQGIAPGAGGLTGGIGGRLGGGQQQQREQVAPPMQPNGIRIRGYARTTQALQHFVERLREDGAFRQVFFNDAISNPVNWSEMQNTGTAPAVAGGTRRGGGEEDRGGFSGLNINIGAVQPGRPQGGLRGMAPQESVIPFIIDLQISGPQLDERGNPVQGGGQPAPQPAPGLQAALPQVGE